jgi:hypothetical protein
MNQIIPVKQFFIDLGCMPKFLRKNNRKDIFPATKLHLPALQCQIPNLDKNGRNHPRVEINGHKRKKVDKYGPARSRRYGVVQ